MILCFLKNRCVSYEKSPSPQCRLSCNLYCSYPLQQARMLCMQPHSKISSKCPWTVSMCRGAFAGWCCWPCLKNIYGFIQLCTTTGTSPSVFSVSYDGSPPWISSSARFLLVVFQFSHPYSFTGATFWLFGLRSECRLAYVLRSQVCFGECSLGDLFCLQFTYK